MNNFLNSNDIFPILEMIRREIRKNDFDRDRVFNGGDSAPVGNSDDVTSVEVLRGGSTYDPEMINAVVVTYADGTLETMTMIRGVNPPVPHSVPDYEFINNALISGFEVEMVTPFGGRKVIGQIVRENGYGKVERLDVSYIQ